MNQSTVASPTSKRRFDKSRVTRLSNHPERNAIMALWALQRGYPLGRRMSDMERICWAVASTRPTNSYVLSSADLSRSDLWYSFELLLRRIRREPSTANGPTIYVATVAQAVAAAGHHLHVLLWKRPHMPLFHKHTTALGLGKGSAKRIGPTPEDAISVTSYALGQQESVFGTKDHWRNEQREKGARRFRCPQQSTLSQFHPELFHALNMAKNESLTDIALASRLPIALREVKGPQRDIQMAAEATRSTTHRRTGEADEEAL